MCSIDIRALIQICKVMLKHLAQRIATRYLAKSMLPFDPFLTAADFKDRMEEEFPGSKTNYHVEIDRTRPRCEISISIEDDNSLKKLSIRYDRDRDLASIEGKTITPKGQKIPGIHVNVESRDIPRILSRVEPLFN